MTCDRALRTWLEDRALHQYRNPAERCTTYRELLASFPPEPKDVQEYCRALYLCGRLKDLEDALTPWLASSWEDLRGTALYWAGHLAWVKGQTARARLHWQKCVEDLSPGVLQSDAKIRVRLTQVAWRVEMSDGLVIYFQDQLTLPETGIRELIGRLTDARQRFVRTVGQPIAAVSRVYLYPDIATGQEAVGPERFGCADTQLGEIHDTLTGSLLAELLFTVDGGWPNYHPELFAGLCAWAEADPAELRQAVGEAPVRPAGGAQQPLGSEAGVRPADGSQLRRTTGAPVLSEVDPLSHLPHLLVSWYAPQHKEVSARSIASLLEFLIQRHGWPCLIDWMREKELIQSFPQIFHVTWEQARAEWLAWRSPALAKLAGQNPQRTVTQPPPSSPGDAHGSVKAKALAPASVAGSVAAAAETKAFWQAVQGGDWRAAEQWLVQPLAHTCLELELGADPEYLRATNFEPQATAVVGDTVVQHYVLEAHDTTWAVCRLIWTFMQAGPGWRLQDVRCYATDPAAWKDRSAAGYTPNRPWPGEEFRERVLELAAAHGLQSPVICEMGIGSGRIARAFIEAKDRYIGIDNNPFMLRYLLKQFGGQCPDNLRLLVCDVQKGVPLPDESVDIILEVQTFLPDPVIFLEYARLVRPGGFVLAQFSSGVEIAPPSWPLLDTYEANLWRRLNVVWANGRQPWPKEEWFTQPRPVGGEREAEAKGEPPPQVARRLPPPDQSWDAQHPFAAITYPCSLRHRYRETRLNRLFFGEVGYEPWWSERARLLDAEAERLGIRWDDTIPGERRVVGSLWEARTLKRWAAAAAERGSGQD